MTEAVLEAGSWVYKMLVTLVLAVVCVGIVGLVVRSERNTIDVQRELLFNRLLYDPQGFLYTDADTGVTVTASVNKAWFDRASADASVADASFRYLPNYGGAELSLLDGTAQTTVRVNAPTYESIRVSSAAGIDNSGQLVTRTYPVTIYDNGARRGGWLVITVAMPARA